MTRITATVVVLLLMTGCASAPSASTTTDYDKNVDFSKFTTYGFAPGKIIEQPDYESIDRQRLEERIRAAVVAEMEVRGLDYVTDSPQLLVTYTAGAQQKADLVRIAPTYTGHDYDAPGAWRPAGWYAQTEEQFWSKQYIEGTLLLDIYDTQTKQAVWKSYTKVQIMSDEVQRNRAPEVIAGALKGFPPKR